MRGLISEFNSEIEGSLVFCALMCFCVIFCVLGDLEVVCMWSVSWLLIGCVFLRREWCL